MADVESETVAITLESAANEYFSENAKKLDQRQRVAVTRFVSWCGPTRVISDISAHEMALFQEAQGENVAGLADRLMPVKAFFAHAKKRKWTESNMGVHLRVKKARVSGATKMMSGAEIEAVQMTTEGLVVTKAELDRLRAERPAITKDLELAMADKDFRENAPLDAARDAQAHLEARIRDLEHQVAHAVVTDASADIAAGVVHLGSTVEVTNLVTDRTIRYTLVGQNEVDAAAGRISVASPVGQALVGQGAGKVVSVSAPSGKIEFRIEAVEG